MGGNEQPRSVRADEVTAPGTASSLPMWFVTVTFAGAPVPDEHLQAGLHRLTRERPFLVSVRYRCDRVEIRYWDEAEDLDDAAALALRLWFDHRDSAGLPDWAPVALEVLDQATARERSGRSSATDQASGTPPLLLGGVAPL